MLPNIIRREVTVAITLLVLVAPGIAQAQTSRQREQEGRKDDARSDRASCRRAARIVLGDAHAPAPRAVRGENDEREGDDDEGRSDVATASARLLSCGSMGGAVAGAVIRAMRSEREMSRLTRIVSPYRNFRDTAVFAAAIDVARDNSASESARIQALNTLYILRTGNYWVGYRRMLGSVDPTFGRPVAACTSGLEVSDAKPFWYAGASLPLGFGEQIRALADQLWRDESQPLQVRAAASCALQGQ
jgi:hypothetical protein